MIEPGAVVIADREQARFYRRPLPNPGFDRPQFGVPWSFTQGDVVVCRHGEDPPIAINLNRAWREAWPRLDSGGEHYLVVAAHSFFALGQWRFYEQTLEPAGLILEEGRSYAGSLRLYVAPGDGGVSLSVRRVICQADVDLGGVELASYSYTTVPQDGEPWPIGKWSRIDIPEALCDVAGLPGLRMVWNGPGLPNRVGAIGLDNFVLADVSRGPRRDLP